VVAAHGEVLLARWLAAAGGAASVRVGPLPHLLEVAAAAARRPGYVVVLAPAGGRRAGLSDAELASIAVPRAAGVSATRTVLVAGAFVTAEAQPTSDAPATAPGDDATTRAHTVGVRTRRGCGG
jgi:hypothetical protein